MKRTSIIALAVVAFLTASGAAQAPPSYRVVPLWPQPLPNHWVLGSVTGVAVDAARGGEAAARGGDAARGAAPAGRGRGAAAPAGPPDAHVLKFARDGKFLLQIGTPGKMDGPDSQTTLNRPAAVAVDSAANEV